MCWAGFCYYVHSFNNQAANISACTSCRRVRHSAAPFSAVVLHRVDVVLYNYSSIFLFCFTEKPFVHLSNHPSFMSFAIIKIYKTRTVPCVRVCSLTRVAVVDKVVPAHTHYNLQYNHKITPNEYRTSFNSLDIASIQTAWGISRPTGYIRHLC